MITGYLLPEKRAKRCGIFRLPGFIQVPQRAVQTAELVAGGRQIPVVIEDRIREISFGEWEGLSCSRDNYEIPSDSFEQFSAIRFSSIRQKEGKCLGSLQAYGTFSG